MDNKFKNARQNASFVEDVNSDIEQDTIATNTLVTRNQKSVTIEPNTLGQKERSRTKHGRSLSVPLFVEELSLIEQTVEHLNKKSDISLSNFIRQTLLERCQKVLGKDEFNKISDLKYNVVKNKH